MQTNIKKFLQFNGKNVYFKAIDGQWWIAIKPICEALGVDYERQRRKLKTHKILGQLPSIQTVVASDERIREMVCLPEFFIYGWLFQIQSDSPDLQEYQWKCYELLYNYFHGTITGRSTFLQGKTKTELEMEELESRLSENPDYTRLKELKSTIKTINKELVKLDKELVTSQLELWQTEKTNQ